MFEYPLLFIFPLAMAYAAVSDLLTMTIPNRISLVLLATFFVLAPLASFTWVAFWQHLAVGGVVLAAGVALFALGVFGGGDAKLLAAAALWLGLDHIVPFFGNVAIIGGVMCVVILLYRKMVPAVILSLPGWSLPGWAVRLHDPKSGVPYGIAIAGAALLIYPKTQWYSAFIS